MFPADVLYSILQSKAMMAIKFCVSARQALGKGQNLLTSVINEGNQRREIRSGVDPNRLALLVISALEGALMIGRLERNRDALLMARSHLDDYLDREVRAHSIGSRTSKLRGAPERTTNHQ